MTLQNQINMYNTRQYDFAENNTFHILNNRLLCSFVDKENIDSLVNNISSKYNVMYNKIFVLHIPETDEYALTYNIDQGNVNLIPENTILVHRKKEFNCLYSINSINELVKNLNNGYIDPKFPINWSLYKNSILLTQEGKFKQLKTKISKIVNL